MRIRRVNFNNIEYLIVYISSEEKSDVNVNREILALKKKNRGVAVFVGGSSCMESVLTIISQEKS